MWRGRKMFFNAFTLIFVSFDDISSKTFKYQTRNQSIIVHQVCVSISYQKKNLKTRMCGFLMWSIEYSASMSFFCIVLNKSFKPDVTSHHMNYWQYEACVTQREASMTWLEREIFRTIIRCLATCVCELRGVLLLFERMTNGIRNETKKNGCCWCLSRFTRQAHQTQIGHNESHMNMKMSF